MSEDRMFKITAVHGLREWTGKYGPNVDYTIELEGLAGRHTLTQKPTTPAPTVGEELLGHAEDGGEFPSGDPKPPKFVKAKPAGGFPGGGNGGRAKDPAERESIERQVAAKCASDLLVGFMATGWKPDTALKLGELHTVLAKQIAAEIKL